MQRSSHSSIRTCAAAIGLSLLASMAGLADPPVPELFHYKFNGIGTSVFNAASNPPPGTATATIVGNMQQGPPNIGGSAGGSLHGSGSPSSSDFVNTGWATNLTGSWSISFKTSNIPFTGANHYILGDVDAGEFRVFTGGVAGPGNWVLRGLFNSVLATGGASEAPSTTTFVHDSVAGVIKAYVNGVLVNTVSQPEPLSIVGPGPFKVGAYSNTTNLPGLMDDFRLYNRALTEQEVMSIHIGAPSDPLFTLLQPKGVEVPGAGVDPNIPAGAVWFSFGTPAIDGANKVAYVGKWRNPPKTPAGVFGTGLFVDDTMLTSVGAPVPGAGTGSLPADATFKSFQDPVISAGAVALLAKIKGTGVTIANDSVVLLVPPAGPPVVLAREGDVATGTGGQTFKTFKTVSISGVPTPETPAGVLYTATLNAATGTNDGAWLFQNGMTSLVVQEGVSTATGYAPGELVKSFTLLNSPAGSPGQRRGQVGPQSVSFAAKSSLRASSLLRFTVAGGLVRTLSSGTAFDGGLNASWTSFGVVSETDRVALLGSLKGPDVRPTEAKGIFLGDLNYANWIRVAHAGGIVPGAGTGTLPADGVFKSFKDPVLAANGGGLAFPAVIAGAGISTTNDSSLWWRSGSGALTLVAQEGTPAPGDAVWQTFSSVALPGGGFGPIFTANLRKDPGGVTAADDAGLYAAMNDGAGVFELIRENQPLLGRTVKSFTVLKGIPGTLSSGREFNNTGSIVLRVLFTDKVTALVRVDVP